MTVPKFETKTSPRKTKSCPDTPPIKVPVSSTNMLIIKFLSPPGIEVIPVVGEVEVLKASGNELTVNKLLPSR